MCHFDTRQTNCAVLKHNNRMNIGLRIKELRKEKSLSQEKLAKELGVGRTTITRWETGERYPELEKVVEISNFFNVSTDFLLGKQDY